jgi:hypothetical protein
MNDGSIEEFSVDDYKKFLDLQDREIRANAYHEAGHAVVDMMYGFEVNFVSTEIGGGACGESLPRTGHNRRTTSFLNRRSWGLRTRHRAHGWATGIFAGIMAEAKMLNVDWQTLRETSGKGDYDSALSVAGRFSVCDGFASGEGTTKAYINLWEQKAAIIVNHVQVWPSIVALAEELNESEYVMGADLEAMFTRTLDPMLLAFGNAQSSRRPSRIACYDSIRSSES